MRKFLLASLLAASVAATAAPALAELHPGDTAPPFDTQASLGGRVFDFNIADELQRSRRVVRLKRTTSPSISTITKSSALPSSVFPAMISGSSTSSRSPSAAANSPSHLTVTTKSRRRIEPCSASGR